jgi:3-hydroxyisobutyrate dehydrogenase
VKIGFIGPGRMGRPMLDRLVAAGHDVSVLVRRPQARAAAEAAGLSWAGTVAATVRDADAVFVVVLTDEQVRSVCLGPDGAIAAMKPGATLIQHTTSDPLTAGDEAVLDEMRPVLDSYAAPVMFVGPAGHGQRVKLVNNALFVAQVGLAIDAVRLAGSLGIEEQAILAALPHGSGASRALSVVARGGSVDAVAERLADLMLKDVTVVREVAQSAGADLGIIGTVLSSDVVAGKVLHRAAAPGRI